MSFEVFDSDGGEIQCHQTCPQHHSFSEIYKKLWKASRKLLKIIQLKLREMAKLDENRDQFI